MYASPPRSWRTNGHLDIVTTDLSAIAATSGGRHPIAQALLTGEHQVCNDIEQDPALKAHRDEALRRGYRALAVFPIKVGGHVTGTFNLYADEPGVFDAAEVQLLDELAVDIAFALEGCEREQERQRASDKLSKSEELFRELAETIQEVFWVTAPDGSGIIYVSPAYETIWQRSRQTLYEQPKSWVNAIHEKDRDRVVQAAATQQIAGRYDEEYRIVRPDGQVRWIRERAFPVRNASSQVERIVGVARDITEGRQMGDQLRQSQKMEAIGQLAGGVVNARDAMLGCGSLTIATGEAVWDDALAKTHPEAAPGHYVFLSVTDTGSGIAPATLPHIFEPFFTTKEVGKGTGLGLATIFGIVKQHRGSIAVDSILGRGTTFQVLFPAAEGVAASPADATSRPRLPGGRETILLVEDEPMVRAATCTILRHHGYTLLEASTGVEALKVWQSHRGSVALLLTDLVMPSGVGGQELARQLQADRPDLKVVYTSGYSAEIAGRQIELNAGENFLPKPFQVDVLLEVVRRSLDS